MSSKKALAQSLPQELLKISHLQIKIFIFNFYKFNEIKLREKFTLLIKYHFIFNFFLFDKIETGLKKEFI